MTPRQQMNSTTRAGRLLLVVERTALALGLACLACWFALHVDRAAGMQYEMSRFATLRAAESQAEAPDLSLWSPVRIAAWRDTLKAAAPPPLAVLRVPKVGIEVPVLPGTDEFVLNRAVGHIEDTALPGTDGNIGIAGHRDGFFRGLKDVAPGDVLELETLKGATEVYRVERIWIVKPEEVWVLDPTPTRSVTLVTCYPFYHVGSAPERFIVRAVRERELPRRS